MQVVKSVLPFCFFILVACDAGEPKSYAQKLFADVYTAPYMNDEIIVLLDSVKGSKNVRDISLVKKFILENNYYKQYAYVTLYLMNQDSCITFLYKHGNELKGRELGYFLDNIKEMDTALNNVLIAIYKNSNDWTVKRSIAYFLQKNGTNENVKTISSYITIDSDKTVRSALYASITRFQNENGDLTIVNLLKNYNEPEVINYLLMTGIVEHNRYDFLPALYSLANRLEGEMNVEKIAAAKETSELIKDAISVLEQKKLEKAPIGLPLDWPNGHGKK